VKTAGPAGDLSLITFALLHGPFISGIPGTTRCDDFSASSRARHLRSEAHPSWDGRSARTAACRDKDPLCGCPPEIRRHEV